MGWWWRRLRGWDILCWERRDSQVRWDFGGWKLEEVSKRTKGGDLAFCPYLSARTGSRSAA